MHPIKLNEAESIALKIVEKASWIRKLEHQERFELAKIAYDHLRQLIGDLAELEGILL